MNQREQVEAFERDLSALVSRYAAEYDLSTAAALGVLALQMHRMMVTTMEDSEDAEQP